MKPSPPFSEALDRISTITTMKSTIKAMAWRSADRRRCIMEFNALSLGGPVPQTPWGFSLWAEMQIGGRHSFYRHADRATNCIAAASGARVASLHGPILRTIASILEIA